MKTIITLHENEEYYVDKSYKLNYIVIKNIITSTASLYLDKKIKLSQGFNIGNLVILNMILDGRSFRIIYERDSSIIYYEDRLYDIMQIEMALYFE